MVKHLPTVRETQVQSLGREDPLEKEMATHSNILAWKIPWTEKPCGLESIALQRVGTRPSDFTFTSGAFLIGQPVKYLPAKQETRVPSLSWEDPLEKEMATYSIIFAWRIP